MKIYTRKGDAGMTGMLGGERVTKHDPRVEAYGAVDELNSHIGLALALGEGALPDPSRILQLQEDLFVIGARLAAARPKRALERGLIPCFSEQRIVELEEWIDELESSLPSLDVFLLPGGSPLGAQLQVSRTVCRRAERAISRLLTTQPDLGEIILPYLNRLSDLLFVLARAANHQAGVPDPEWRPVGTRRYATGAEPDDG
ncbi:MAG: cob(I)yrinic acid a,c-diamide adenosyltransferase [Gemmatimonadota bacterium]|nr:MAG: cob(I)yrinic acid a,c-diamide adenosyltransferase [Gemmatimonadota bacterium]